MTTCPKLVESGVYVLGALPPGQRLDYERHLATCAECRAEVGDLAVLPGLLGRLDADSVAALDVAEPAPPTVLPIALGRVRKQRRMRRFTAGAAALAAAAVTAVVALLIPNGTGPVLGGPGPSSSVPVTQSPSTPVAVAHTMSPVGGEDRLTADVAFTPTTGGTRVDVTCKYLGTLPPNYQGPPPRFSLFLISRNGSPTQQIATWTALPGDTVTVPAMSWWKTSNIARVELRGEDGTTLLRYQNS
jgi:hypothetical protein